MPAARILHGDKGYDSNANGVDPQYYLADVIARIVAGHPQSQNDDLLPWAYAATQLKAVA